MIFWATKDMIGGFGASERLFTNIITDQVESSKKEIKRNTDTFEGKIEFRNVSFTYPNTRINNPEVLKNLNFIIKPNQRVALVGPTGCGKTTLAKLLLRLYRPEKGEILLDGYNIRDYPLERVRQRVGLIEQDVFLFSQTIEENIKFGKPSATHEEVLQVAKFANVHDFVESMPQEYETIVGERGTKLSGGEKQRIAIARAFLTDPDILILDDSMSAIDSETEEKIGKAINNILKNRTTIIITHRLHTIRTSDLILVMKNGEIIAQGNHPTLLKNSLDYRKIFGKQTTHANILNREEES
jgi:ATP-binding cassette subfamily B protein